MPRKYIRNPKLEEVWLARRFKTDWIVFHYSEIDDEYYWCPDGPEKNDCHGGQEVLAIAKIGE